jgi:hypothetical protein
MTFGNNVPQHCNFSSRRYEGLGMSLEQGRRYAYRSFIRRYLGKCSLGKPRKTWEDITMMDVREIN